ncbi:MAG: 2Fe-2S iron-sulfur cluster-binding protein [Candidatus Heimdallarchaeaceae archaeon]
MIKVVIDDQEIEAEEGQTLLEVAQGAGIKIPTLCYHKALSPYGSCRLCVVEINHNGRIMYHTSCQFPVMENLVVKTNTERVIKGRQVVAELLLARCPDSEKIQEVARELGVKETRFKEKDENCILCGLCARICQERMGVGTIDFINRGIERDIQPPFKKYSDICRACGACATVCPTNARVLELEALTEKEPRPIFSEFDEGLVRRTAIYTPFPQAVPKVPVIDRDNCSHFLLGQCQICAEICEPKAINHEQEDEIVELEIGSIVVATGFDNYDPTEKPEYGYKESANVITGLQFERLVNASGPTLGHLEINGKEPDNIVFIQCVGSRDKNGHEYCSRVCCMYTAKQAHMVRDKFPDAEITVYNTDVRAFGKGFEEFYNRVQGENIKYLRRELDESIEVVGNEEGVIVKAEGHPEIHADLVVLATGLIPREDSKEMSRKLNINMSEDGYYLEAHPKLRPVDTFTDGIFLAGSCQSPKDIPDTVAQASSAASRVCNILSQTELEIEATVAKVDEDLCRGCGLCVETCPYSAIELIIQKKFGYSIEVANVNEVLCKGCGTCSAACLNGAIFHLGYTDDQILAQIKALGEE